VYLPVVLVPVRTVPLSDPTHHVGDVDGGTRIGFLIKSEEAAGPSDAGTGEGPGAVSSVADLRAHFKTR
jgi:hypothetical protein